MKCDPESFMDILLLNGGYLWSKYSLNWHWSQKHAWKSKTVLSSMDIHGSLLGIDFDIWTKY